MPKRVIVEKGKEKTIEISPIELAACSAGDASRLGYHGWVELFATHVEAQEIVERELKGTLYLLRQDAFRRHGLEVYRVYLNNRDQQVRLASKYFDAWQHCQFCGSFDVVLYQDHTTNVFCNNCRIHRKYHPSDAGGRDPGTAHQPDRYDLALAPRAIAYKDTMPAEPPAAKVIGHYHLFRHRRTGLIYRLLDHHPNDKSKGLFEHTDAARTRYSWLKMNELEFHAVNLPIRLTPKATISGAL